MNEGLNVGNDSPSITDPEQGIVNSNASVEKCAPVMAVSNHDVVNSTVDSSELVPSKEVAEATPDIIAQEAARWQLPVYRGAYIEGFVQEVDATLTVDTGACDTMVSHRLLEKISDDHRASCKMYAQEGVLGVKL